MFFPINLTIDGEHSCLVLHSRPEGRVLISSEFLKELQDALSIITEVAQRSYTIESSCVLLNKYLQDIPLETPEDEEERFKFLFLRSKRYSYKENLCCLVKIVNYLNYHGSKIFPDLFENASSKANLLITEAKDNINALIQQRDYRPDSSKTTRCSQDSVISCIDAFLGQSEKERPDFAVPKTCVSSDPNDLDEQQIIKCLTEIAPGLFLRKSHNLVRMRQSIGMNLVFELQSIPGIIFKVSTYHTNNELLVPRLLNEGTQAKEKGIKRHQNSETIKQHIQASGFYRNIYLPKAKLFLTHNNTIAWVAEEKLPIEADYNAVVMWQFYDRELRDAFVELAKLIQATHLSDIQPKNLPAFYRENKWLIGIIDVEKVSLSQISLKLKKLLEFVESEESKMAILEVCSPDFVTEYLGINKAEQVLS